MASTVRSAIDPTIGEPSADKRLMYRQQAISECLKSRSNNLVETLRKYPALLHDRSLILELAVEEFRANRTSTSDLEQHCRRFDEFGSSITRSIFNQLQAQRFIDDHPELLEALSTAKWPSVGDTVANCQIIEKLGFGATAHVYLCKQLDVGNREIVIKATPFSSFEASILGRLNHPNIIPIYSTGFDDERELHFLCMPFRGRSTLTDFLDIAFKDGLPRRGDKLALAANCWLAEEQSSTRWQRFVSGGISCRTYVDTVLGLAIQIADALGHAHEQQVVHGDLKPSNVLLTPLGVPLLLDFNLSQDYSGSTAKGGGGTLAYMPPEHLRLVAKQLFPTEQSTFEPRSDVYSFGALLYQLLTGVTPVSLPNESCDLAEVATRVLNQLTHGPPGIRQFNPLVSRRLESLVMSCLAFDITDRPAAMLEIKRRLHRETIFLASIGRVARARPIMCSAVAGLMVAALSGAALFFTLRPALHVRAYDRGMHLAASGEITNAAEQLALAVSSNPNYLPARFELARNQLKLGQIDHAMDNFVKLVRIDNNSRSMAYLGYCFNLKRIHAGAIEWYKRAIIHGAISAEVYNNLGASYIDAGPRPRYADQLNLAAYYLRKAHALSPRSTSINLNLVRWAEALAGEDKEYHPGLVWNNAEVVLQVASDDPLAQFHLVGWYEAVLEWEAAHNDRRSLDGRIPSISSSTRDTLALLYESIWPHKQEFEPTRQLRSRKLTTAIGSTSAVGYFLEPNSLQAGRP